ncbi:hypothetical protein ILUMI_24901 [Ignelater luminosus]|uniref:Uncharacterized protein n=1 Tax=Ignelater luminosus TaxID=2038154 RepID=A0A8K0C9E2_IGNLU|nr:hypothetical protein ILUMI_24901 [Ignelater luminosus]
MHTSSINTSSTTISSTWTFHRQTFHRQRAVYLTTGGAYAELSADERHRGRSPDLLAKYTNISDPDYALNVRKLMSLAFVPPQDVIKSFQDRADSQFYQQHKQILRPLRDYFEDSWIRFPSCGNRRRPPSVPLEIWNQYEGTLAGLPKTNSYIEGWFKKVSHLLAVTTQAFGILLRS